MQQEITAYCSSEAKNFSYTFTAVEPFLFFDETKIVIQLFSFTAVSALRLVNDLQIIYQKPICQHSLLKHAYVRIWTLIHWLTKMICLFSFSICLQGNLTNIKRDNAKYLILYWPMNKVIGVDEKLIFYLRMKISLLIRHVGMKPA